MPSHVVVRARERFHDGDTFVYDVEVTGEDGRVLERWEGLRLQRVASVASTGTWPEALLGPYIERRLGEILPGAKVSVAFEPRGTGDRIARSDRVIQQATGSSGPVYRRTGGKPEVCCQQEVSAAHTGELTMAIAAGEPVACDVEPVNQRSPSVWRDLLTPERYTLAELVAGRMAEDRNRAATRVWTAAECLKKMGRDFDTPLLFHSRTEDDWAVLTAGALNVATWVGQVRDTEEELAFSICLETCGASV
jgi:enediyne polyketide synthase